MKRKLIQIALLLLFVLVLSNNDLYGQIKTYIDERSGVEIIFNTSESIFPESWYDSPSNAKIKTIKSEEDIKRSLMIIKKALGKYPIEVLKTNLKKVYILYDISFYNVGYGGTYWEDNVYITNQEKSNGYDDIFVEQLFHAEFSSILYLNYKQYFNKNAWKTANAPDAEYGDGGYEAIKNGSDSEDFNEEVNKLGFLTQYGMSDMENDFNSFAKNIFSSDPGFWELFAKYKRLNKKLNLIINFYNSIDPQFTIEYFRKVSTDYEK
jgi:hypothetical protein